MNVLVTGGAGFIGSHLVDALAKEHSVTVLDITGLPSHLEKSQSHISYTQGDIRDNKLVTDAIKGNELVFHLAADVKIMKSIDDPLTNHDINVRGTLNVLNACVQEKVKRFVFCSSAAVYGEPRYLPVDEAHPTQPASPYAAGKLSAEGYLSAFSASYGLETVILRFFNVYGPRQGMSEYASVIPAFFTALKENKPLTIYGDGEQTRDFVYVADVVKTCILAGTLTSAAGQLFNIASGKGLSINQLADIMQKVTGRRAPVINEAARIGEIKDSRADVKKASEMLGFSAQTNLESGLKLTWEHLQRLS